MTNLACILSDLLSCSALYFEYPQDFFHETIRFYGRGRNNVSCIQNMAALMFIPPTTIKIMDFDSLSKFSQKKGKIPGFELYVKILESKITRVLKIKFVRLVL